MRLIVNSKEYIEKLKEIILAKGRCQTTTSYCNSDSCPLYSWCGKDIRSDISIPRSAYSYKERSNKAKEVLAAIPQDKIFEIYLYINEITI